MNINTVFYAIFFAHPASNPPFSIELGRKDEDGIYIENCQHIPDAVEKIQNYCLQHQIKIDKNFTLLYPIYLDVMNTEHESTMHHIAWLIKEQADKKQWKFDRFGGYSNKTAADFIPKE